MCQCPREVVNAVTRDREGRESDSGEPLSPLFLLLGTHHPLGTLAHHRVRYHSLDVKLLEHQKVVLLRVLSDAVVRREGLVEITDTSCNTVDEWDVIRVQVALLEMKQNWTKIEDPLFRKKQIATEAAFAKASAKCQGDRGDAANPRVECFKRVRVMQV